MAQNPKVSADHNAPPITRMLAEFVANHPSRGWSDAVEHEAHRTILNWFGCAIGAATHPAMDAALGAMMELSPSPQASILGRKEKVDLVGAALLNGISSHTFDFDDTHLKTIIHPAGPVASALLALAEKTGASGREIIDALVLGIDVSCRIGNMMYPDHYDRGWHITGSTGTLGAAAGCARLLGLDADKTAMAIGIAASQPIGVREQFGTMSKALHIGAAARAGLLAALLAEHGFTASRRAIEAPRGFAQTVSTRHDWHEISDQLGHRFEISFNTYKPFACGIVIHPTIEAAIQLRARGVLAEHIEQVELKVHSLVLELTGNKDPHDGLQGKFSVYHGFAAGLIFGRAGEPEFDDAIVRRDDVRALRGKVLAAVDDSLREDATDAIAILKDGRREHVFVAHAIGSMQRPMSDAMLEAKVRDLALPVIGREQVEALIAACWKIGEARDVAAMVSSARP